MNYDDMTDFAINELVAGLLGLKVADKEDSRTYSPLHKESYPSVVWAAKQENGKQIEAWEQVNYCNDWGDMGPIIQECGIEITWPVGGYWGEQRFEGSGFAAPSGGDGQHTTYFDTKGQALRAAAICFLKMKESEK